MDELPDYKAHVSTSFLIENRTGGDGMKMNKRKITQSDCCDASVIIIGQKTYKCVKCGGCCAIGTDYESMSYMSKSIS